MKHHRPRLTVALVGLALTLSLAPAGTKARAATLFRRGDANADGGLNLADAISILSYLFSSGPHPECEKSNDTDDDGTVGLTDAVLLLGHLFGGGAALSAPFSACGADPTPDGLTCETFAPCEFETLVASYDLLVTIAGKGEIRSKGVSGWESSYEGDVATGAELSRPHHAIADDAGNVYIADKDAHAVRKVTPEGRIVTVAGTNVAGDSGDAPGPGTERRLSAPNGIWVRGDGTVYILDLGNSKVRRLDREGELSTLFSVPGGIALGRGLWVREDEELAYVASGGEVKRWTPEGGVETYAAGFTQLGNLAVSPAGDLVVTDRGQNRVFRIGADRTAVPIAGDGSESGGGDGAPALATGLHGVRGIWFLPSGAYFLATHEGNQVWYVDTQGTIHLFLDGGSNNAHAGDGEHFRTPGLKISEARAISVDAQGNVIVTENDFGFIRVVRRRS